MRQTLPFDFDTSGATALILKGAFALLLVLGVGLAYTLLWLREPWASLGLLFAVATVAYFARVFVKRWTVSSGTIRADAVTLRPVHLYGFRLAGVDGTFPIERFKAVRVERVSAPIEGQGGPHARVYLVGKDATLDVLIARADREEGEALAHSLASALGLSLEQTSTPY